MNLLFRESVRQKKWQDLSPEMQEAITIVAAGSSQSLAFCVWCMIYVYYGHLKLVSIVD